MSHRVNDFLDKISILQIFSVVVLANIADWVIESELVFWLTTITVILSAFLALRKFIITLAQDVLKLIKQIKYWRGKKKRKLMKLLIKRKSDNGIQTLGEGSVIADDVLFTFKTLELPWKDNQRRISCVPKGTYTVVKFNSPKFGEVFLLLKVPNRDMVEIHYGNYHTDIQGCILVGEHFSDINKDGQLDVTNSKDTLKDLLDIMPETFKLDIV